MLYTYKIRRHAGDYDTYDGHEHYGTSINNILVQTPNYNRKKLEYEKRIQYFDNE